MRVHTQSSENYATGHASEACRMTIVSAMHIQHTVISSSRRALNNRSAPATAISADLVARPRAILFQ